MKDNVIKDKTFAFGKRIIRMCVYLERQKKEYVLSKQIKRSGTAPGALVREAEHAESRRDFVHKMNIALKEANETDYWLEMVKEGDYISEREFKSISKDCQEIIKILASIVKSTKQSLKNQ